MHLKYFLSLFLFLFHFIYMRDVSKDIDGCDESDI